MKQCGNDLDFVRTHLPNATHVLCDRCGPIQPLSSLHLAPIEPLSSLYLAPTSPLPRPLRHRYNVSPCCITAVVLALRDPRSPINACRICSFIYLFLYLSATPFSLWLSPSLSPWMSPSYSHIYLDAAPTDAHSPAHLRTSFAPLLPPALVASEQTVLGLRIFGTAWHHHRQTVVQRPRYAFKITPV